MVERYVQMLGVDETVRLLQANDLSMPVTIRTNTLKISPQNPPKAPYFEGIHRLTGCRLTMCIRNREGDYPIGATHEYLFGYYFVQGIASMVPAEILAPHPGEIVVDMCAAPGGKTTHLAQLMNNKGQLYALEMNSARLPALTANLDRCGVHNTLVLNIDAKEFPQFGIRPDKVLLDAPCTGEGTIRTDPTRKMKPGIR